MDVYYGIRRQFRAEDPFLSRQVQLLNRRISVVTVVHPAAGIINVG